MTRVDEPALRPDDVEEIVARVCFPDRTDERCPGRVGLEVERFPVRRGPDAGPAGRVTIDGPGDTSLDVLAALAGSELGGLTERSALPAFPVVRGGCLTFEPGGQLEHVTAVHDTAAGALAEVGELSALLAGAFDAAGITLASAGLDPWHDVAAVPLQLESYRYPAMDAYLRSRGSQGRLMMRHTCALQVNLDLGPAADRRERWLVANLVAPLLTATFANSPTPGRVCGRAAAWQVLDPTRTGFPSRLIEGSSDDPVAQMATSALGADVLLVRTGPGIAEPGSMGWTFADWLRDGHPEHGPATASDLAYHLSTIFFEVRPRGVLEFRGIDALPHPWRAVPVTLLVGALEDQKARSHLRELLAPHRRDLPALWRRASTHGVADPPFCALTVEAWSYALGGAARLPAGYLPGGALAATEAFLERFTLRGRCPADELTERLATGPGSALAWAAEPVPERARGQR